MWAVRGLCPFVEALEFFDQRGLFELQQLRRPTLVSAGPLERTLNQVAFDAGDERVEIDAVLGQRDRRRQCGLLRVLYLDRQVRHIDLRSSRGEGDGALDRILELTHIAGPLIR